MRSNRRPGRLFAAGAATVCLLGSAVAQNAPVRGNQSCYLPNSYEVIRDRTNGGARMSGARTWHGCGLVITNIWEEVIGAFFATSVTRVHIRRCDCIGPTMPNAGGGNAGGNGSGNGSGS